MSRNANPWGAPVAAAAAPVKLHTVMDEELAVKLQREEEEEWEREIAAQFGDRSNVGWCFVEVPSTDDEYGVMSVVQQEVPMEEQNGDPNDPDYAFALELQAQEAEEYDRLRRQEASSMERIQVMQQEPPPKDQQPRSGSGPAGSFHGSGSTRFRRPLSRYQSALSAGEFAVHVEEEYEYESDHSAGNLHHADGEYRPSDLQLQQEDADRDEEDMFLEDDDLPIVNKFNSLDITLRGAPDRKRRASPASSSSPHTSAAASTSSASSSHNHHHHHHHHRNHHHQGR